MTVTPEEKYYVHARPEMLQFVPNTAEKVLDIGCSEGRFGELLKNRQTTEVWGVEPHTASAKFADRRLDNVYVGTVEENIDYLPNAYFDVITCNDVLEHMADPSSVLTLLYQKLVPGGCVVASLPNMRYWETLYQLIFKKDWEYTSCGILDRTHLRFFTQKSMNRLFTDAGYEVERLEGINQYGAHRRFPFHWVTLGWGLGWLRDASYFQFACVAKKPTDGVNSASVPQLAVANL